MAGSFKNRKLVTAFPGAFKRESVFGTPMNIADIDTRHPQSTPTYPSRTVNREQIKDCSGEYIIREDITSRLSRLRFSFDADAHLLSGWTAYGYGAALAPAGTRTNEVQTITPSAAITGGTWFFSFTFEGKTSQSAVLPYNATAAQIQAAADDMKSIGKGNFIVTGTLATTVVFTAAAGFAAYDLPLLVVNSTLLIGGVANIAQTTQGSSKVANITRTTNDQTPVFDLVVGFQGDSTSPDQYGPMALDSFTINGQLKGKVTVDLSIVGSSKTIAAIGYVFPPCVDIDPIYTKDCKISINNNFISDQIREFKFTYNNNIFVNDDPYPYDDIDVVRLEHGDRTSQFSITAYGSKGDTVYGLAESEQIVPVSLIVGKPSNRVIYDAPKTSLRLQEDVIGFAGEANRSTMSIIGVPFYDKNVAGTPDRAFYYGPETATLLST